jgi:hypothetical protein
LREIFERSRTRKSTGRARNIMLFCNVYNINGRISAMTRLDLEVCVFTISTKAPLSMSNLTFLLMVRIPQSKMNALVAELKKFSKENKITLKDFSESEWSDNETLELYTDSAGSETMGVLAFSQKSGCFFSGHISNFIIFTLNVLCPKYYVVLQCI